MDNLDLVPSRQLQILPVLHENSRTTHSPGCPPLSLSVDPGLTLTPSGLRVADVAEFRIPAGKACLPPIVDCSGGMPPSWSISTSPDAGMASPSLSGAQAARRGRPSQDSLGPRLPLPLAGMDKDIRRGRPGQVDAGEGMQPRQREARRLLRKIEDRVLPRLRLGRGCNQGVHGHARRLPQMIQGCQDKGRPGLQEPHAVPQGFGPSSIGWSRSGIPTAVPCG